MVPPNTQATREKESTSLLVLSTDEVLNFSLYGFLRLTLCWFSADPAAGLGVRYWPTFQAQCSQCLSASVLYPSLSMAYLLLLLPGLSWKRERWGEEEGERERETEKKTCYPIIFNFRTSEFQEQHNRQHPRWPQFWAITTRHNCSCNRILRSM